MPDQSTTSATEPVRVRIGEPTHEISQDLWGIFLEDINNCLDGGLNAQLVRNGDFEFDPLDAAGFHSLTAWTIEGDGNVVVRGDDPVHPNNLHYARAAGPVTLTNEGWDGVPLGQSLRLELATWLISGDGSVQAQIVGADGQVLAQAALEVPERGWNWVQVDLEPIAGAQAQRGELRLSVPVGTVVELDAISLRPIGDDGVPLTFRQDLVDALADLHPSFVRFPGGCVAHGRGLANLYHWKETIGPRHTRRQIPNSWNYHQSRQIGYLEYFELCRVLGATPMPIVAAGVCCQNLRGGAQAIPQEEMPAYVQDVLDLVEFANGDTSTTWGALRAELGHPEPFGLRYLGVGNEDEITPEFRDRYAQIEDALRATYPDVVIIGTAGPWPDGHDFDAGWAFARERGTDIVDEHAYRNPRWFHQNVDRYDSYPRDGVGVYFGEYGSWSSTVRSALSEAAFMIGMERNGDIVKLASYAPLLARVGGTQWTPDLIYFDAENTYPSAPYYVQHLFGKETGTKALSLDVTGAPGEPVAVPTAGQVWVQGFDATLSLENITLNGASLDARTVPDGDKTVIADVDPTDVDLTLTLTRTAGQGSVRLGLGEHAPGSSINLDLGTWSGKATAVNRSDDGSGYNIDGPLHWEGLGASAHELRVRLQGAKVQVWLDGQLRHDAEQDLRPEERIVVGAVQRQADGGKETVLRAVNATDSARELQVAADGVGSVRGEVFAGGGPDEGKAFEASPSSLSELEVSLAHGSARAVLPPWSFAVLVLREG